MLNRRGFLKFLGFSVGAGVVATVIPPVEAAPVIQPRLPFPGGFPAHRIGDVVPYEMIIDDQYGVVGTITTSGASNIRWIKSGTYTIHTCSTDGAGWTNS